ncbi:unnamed protein product [Ambrosiozyma monospora]|uniref:Unnamed protein product n=1 Tax=Ambrosiozyma monospora TaxID=43982 RepID=A0ACB5T2N0_AMBMO|nr:unnamed protein product [Ambrosiozyma monospora]
MIWPCLLSNVVLREGEKESEKIFANKLNNIVFHSDVSYELQPPAVTLLAMLQTDVGGDTQFIDLTTAYERLSPQFKQLIDGLQVVHSSLEQAAASTSNGNQQRKPPVVSIHPLVRYHPVLGTKSLFFNRGFVRRIVGLKQEESDNILTFIKNHIESCLDAHIRANWDERTVVLWDNRRLVHSATFDWDNSSLRHAFRVTPLGERPVGSKEEYDAWTPEIEKEKLKRLSEALDATPAEYYEKFVSH